MNMEQFTPNNEAQIESILQSTNGFSAEEVQSLIQKLQVKLTEKQTITTSAPAPQEISVEKSLESIPYQEYEKSFSYFEGGDSFDTKNIKETSTVQNDPDYIFSYNPKTGEVLPKNGGWEYAKSNATYFLMKSFNYTSDVFQKSPSELRFKPAKVDGSGRIIEKGEIYI